MCKLKKHCMVKKEREFENEAFLSHCVNKSGTIAVFVNDKSRCFRTDADGKREENERGGMLRGNREPLCVSVFMCVCSCL